jgi:hypothetical protein
MNFQRLYCCRTCLPAVEYIPSAVDVSDVIVPATVHPTAACFSSELSLLLLASLLNVTALSTVADFPIV